MLDVLIKRGKIIDGSGNPWFWGNIGIEKDKLRIIRGDVSSIEATRVIDARGHIICPGFIDTHSHSDLLALANPLHKPKILQGVTTDLVGLDGMGYAPLSKSNLEMVKIHWSGLSGNPKLDAEWNSVAEYLKVFYHQTSVNIGCFIPNGAVRIEAVGWDNRSATRAEIEKMKNLVRKGMEEGAIGLSSGLNYITSCWADTEELVELCKIVAEFGGVYSTHVRYHKGDGAFDGFREAIEIAKRSGVSLNISHLYINLRTRGRLDELLKIMEDARKDGVDLTFDCYPYELGTSPLNLRIIPMWAQIGTPHKVLESLRSKETRMKILASLVSKENLSKIEDDHSRGLWGNWEEYNKRNYISGVASQKNKWCEGLTLQEISERSGKEVIDCVCDLMIEENMEISYIDSREYPGGDVTVKSIMTHPFCMYMSDGVLIGDMPHPRSYAAFPKVIRWLVKEEKLLRLEQAINKMTFFPARRYGLLDKGFLQDRKKADIIIFDPDTIADKATFSDPKQHPVGIDYIFVNGKLVVENGIHTGVLNGEPATPLIQ